MPSPFRAVFRLTLVLLALACAPAGLLRAQAFTLATSRLDEGFIGTDAEKRERVVAISGASKTAKITVASNASWVRASVQSGNSGLSLEIDNPRQHYVPPAAIITVKSATHTATLSVGRAYFGHSFASVFAEAKHVLHHPTLPRLAVFAADRVMIFDSGDQSLIRWRALPVSAQYGLTDVFFSREGTRLVGIHGTYDSGRLLSLDADTLATLSEIPVAGLTSGYDRLAEGPADIVYHLNQRAVRVLKASSGELLQTLAEPPSHLPPYRQPRNFAHFAISPALDVLWVSYSGSGDYSGEFSPVLVRFEIGADGKLVESGTSPLLRRPSVGVSPSFPQSTDIFFSADGATLACHHGVLSPLSAEPLAPRLFAEPIIDLSPDGGLALTARGLVLFPEGLLVHPLAVSAFSSGNRAVFNQSGDRLIWSNRENFSTSRFLDLDLTEIMQNSPAGREGIPADGAFTLPPASLGWRRIDGAEAYRVHLADSEDLLAADTPPGHTLLGQTTATTWPLAAPAAWPSTVYWRVDTVVGSRVVRGPVRSFRVAAVAPSADTLALSAPRGALTTALRFQLATPAADTPWSLTAQAPWLSVFPASGSGPAEILVEAAPSEFPVGHHESTLTLAAGGDALALPVVLQIDPLGVTHLRDAPDSFTAYALSQAAGTDRVHLLKIDAATGHILRSMPAGVSATDLALHPLENRLYVAHWREAKLRAFDADSLAFLQSYDADLPATLHGDARGDIHRVFPGRAGRVLVETGPRPDTDSSYYHRSILSLLDTASGARLDSIIVNLGASAVSDLVGGRYYREGIATTETYGGYYSLNALDLAADRLLTGRTYVGNYYNPHISFFVSLLPAFRLYANAYSYDSTFAAQRAEPDILQGVSADETLKLSTHVAYLNGEIRRPPPGHLRILDQDSGRILTVGEAGFVSSDPASLPAAWPVQLSVQSFTDQSVTLEWTQPEGSVPSSATVQVQRQTPGAGTWEIVYPEVNLTTRRATLGYHPAESTRLFRVRYYDRGVYTPWSEPASVTFAIARPALPSSYGSAYVEVDSKQTASVLVDFAGKELSIEAEGLPPGLSYSPETRSIVGTPTVPGRYEVKVTASNVSGSLTRTVQLVVTTDTASAALARYTGMLDIEGGPLAGTWSLRRSGSVVTGSYKSALFTRSFRATFGPPASSPYPEANNRRYATTRVSYNGVGIRLELTWDVSIDRISLLAYTNSSNLVQNFSAPTTPESGLPSYWEAKNSPHPAPGRYTGLLIPGENSGSLSPEGSGFFRLDLDTAGTAKISGETALGQKFTQALPLSDQHSLSFFYFSGITLALGGLELTDVPEAQPRLIGEFIWARDASRKSSVYRDGFEQQLLVIGAPLPPAGKALPPLAPLANEAARADFALAGGGLARLSKPIAQKLTPTPAGFTAPKPGSAENPNRVAVKLDPKTGVVTGSAAILNATGTKVVRTQKFRAQFVKDPLGDGQDVIGGYFLLPDGTGASQSGLVEITEPETTPEPTSP